jgi:hypothetical protein
LGSVRDWIKSHTRLSVNNLSVIGFSSPRFINHSINRARAIAFVRFYLFPFGPVLGQAPTCFLVIIIIRHAGNSTGRLQVLVKTRQPHGCTALLFDRFKQVFGRLLCVLAYPDTGGQRSICAHPVAGR